MDKPQPDLIDKANAGAAPGRPMFAEKDPGNQILTPVVLKKDHTHAGEKYKAGDTIEVNDADKKWLADNQVI